MREIKITYNCKHCGKRIIVEIGDIIYRLKEPNGSLSLLCQNCLEKLIPDRDDGIIDESIKYDTFINVRCQKCCKTLKLDEFDNNCYPPQGEPYFASKHWCNKCWKSLQEWIKKKNNEKTKIYCALCKREKEMLVVELKKKSSDFVQKYVCSNCKRKATIYNKKHNISTENRQIINYII